MKKCKCGKELSAKHVKICRECYLAKSKRENVFCECGKPIDRRATHCRDCFQKGELNHQFGKVGELNSRWIGGIEARRIFCICGKELNATAYYEGNTRCKSCARKEQYKNPENHPQWLGGLSRLPYTIEFNKQLKDLIRDRDNHECQKCNKHEEQEVKDLNKVLSIHHIDYNKQNCLPENLISLCSKCNTEVNADRDYWFAYFTELLMHKIKA
jgi:5-methylcytosine-specific restriction endonuclease McrA